jgi:hypothetical protein
MPDGKALAIATPDICVIKIDPEKGTDIIPLMVVYDNADTLSFGVAYASLDAFKSPFAELTFHGATLELATKEEFDGFRDTGEKNLITREQYYSERMSSEKLLADLGLIEVNNPFAGTCIAYKRFKIPTGAKAEIHEGWIRNGKQRFWSQTHNDAQKYGYYYKSVRQKPMETDTGLVGAGSQLDSFPLSSRLKRYGIPKKPPYLSFFPVKPAVTGGNLTRDSLNPEKLTEQVPSLFRSYVDFYGGKMRGFAYCYVPYSRIRKMIINESQKKNLVTQNSQVISDEQGLYLSISGAGDNMLDIPSFIYEYDQYYFELDQFGLGSTYGDI